MIVTPRLLYVHMPKTGGMWVSQVLQKLAKGRKERSLPRHSPFHLVPPVLFEGRLLLGSIRDPWSWYVSLWQHLRHSDGGTSVLRCLGNGNEGFPAVLRGLTDPGRWTEVPGNGEGWPWPAAATPPPSDGGYYSAMLRWIYGDPCQLQVLVDQAQLREGLSEVLGVTIDPVEFPPVNTSFDWPQAAVSNPDSLYGPKELALVDVADGTVARELGYGGPFSKLPEPLVRVR